MYIPIGRSNKDPYFAMDDVVFMSLNLNYKPEVHLSLNLEIAYESCCKAICILSFIAVPTCIFYAKERKKTDPSKIFTFLDIYGKHVNAISENIMHGINHIQAVPTRYVEFPKLFGMEFGFYSSPQVAAHSCFFFSPGQLFESAHRNQRDCACKENDTR